ncbi:hypothetical protein [Methyloprofundus sp.]|uniref:hypothetical protein n=1 Tax=Methyloprofundus sp. TaxID=2020875 RepID=UPI003D0F9C5A
MLFVFYHEAHEGLEERKLILRAFRGKPSFCLVKYRFSGIYNQYAEAGSLVPQAEGGTKDPASK